MRNRITWTGFKRWLKAQNNDRKMFCNNAERCAVADYLQSTFNPYRATVMGGDGIGIYKTKEDYYTGTRTRISAPAIFSYFIMKFDTRSGAQNAKWAKEVVKIVEKERKLNA